MVCLVVERDAEEKGEEERRKIVKGYFCNFHILFFINQPHKCTIVGYFIAWCKTEGALTLYKPLKLT